MRTRTTVLLFATFILLSSCESFKTQVDLHFLGDVASSIRSEAQPCTEAESEAIFQSLSLETMLQNAESLEPVPDAMPRWDLAKETGLEVNRDLLKGRGSYFETEPLFYMFTPKNWNGRKAILWVPGFGVSDFAFGFIKGFFIEEIKRGYAILVYVLPYHLDRLAPGQPEGKGLITGNLARNIEILKALSTEIARGYRYLSELGVESIGLWGGSIGASASLMLEPYLDFDHIAVMIPVVDWEVLISQPIFLDIKNVMASGACAEDDIRRAYRLVSADSLPLRISKDRVYIMAARLDQLTPLGVIEAYAAERGITNLSVYDESHSTILLNGGVYEGYARFLDKIAENTENP